MATKPTVEEILLIVEKYKKHYSQLWEDFKDVDERFYELDFKNDLKLPTQFKDDGVVLPTARDMVDSIVDHSDVSNPRVFVNKKGTSEMSIKSADMLRKFGLGLLHRTNVESPISPQRVSAKHYWLHGLSVIKTTWDADNWLDKPIQDEKESEEDYASRIDSWRSQTHSSLPIVIQAVNPACILPDPYTAGQLNVIEIQRKLVYDAKRLPFKWNNPQDKKEDDEVEYIEYWDKDYRCVLIDKEPVWKIGGGVIKHKYNFIPYTLIESGLGNVAPDALPQKRYVGLIRYMKDLLISESVVYSMCNILVKWETMLGGYITGADAQTLGNVKQEYGLWWPVGTKEVKFNKWERTMPPREAYSHLALTNDYIAIHSAPRSMLGAGEQGVRSGADRRLVLAEAQSKLNYSKDAFASGWANVLTKCARLVKDVIPGDFEIWTRTASDEFDVQIKKSLFKEPFNFYVEFSPISEEDEYRRHEDLMRLLASGLVTKQWARGRMPDVDIGAMERQELKEKLRNSPAYLQMLSQQFATMLQGALAEAGLATGVPVAGGAPPEQQQGGITGRTLTPPIREVAPPGSAQERENQRLAQMGRPRFQVQQGQGGGGSRSFGV